MSGRLISPILNSEVAVQSQREGIKLVVARPEKELLLFSDSGKCGMLLRVRDPKPPVIDKALKLTNINAFKDNYYSLVIDTPFKTLKKAQPCQILVG